MTRDAGSDAGPLVTECSAERSDLPLYDRDCSGGDFGSRCALFFHQVDCCGTTHAASFAAREAERVLAAENACRAMIPFCDCPSGQGPLRDENGAIVGGGQTVSAMCVDGVCRALLVE